MEIITDNRKLMHHCCVVNNDYMRLPAGRVDDYNLISDLYRRLAQQSLECSMAWMNGQDCPKHEPAVNAFWTAVMPWADEFARTFHMPELEWYDVFMQPHSEFLRFIRHDCDWVPLEQVHGSTSERVMKLDADWMSRVVTLTTRWAFWQYLSEKDVIGQAKRLEQELKTPGSPVQKAYLISDFAFFKNLFEPFPFSNQSRECINKFLASLETEINQINCHLPQSGF